VFQGKWYDEVAVGDRFGASVTVTETHLVLAAGLFGDFNPLHVDEEFAIWSTPAASRRRCGRATRSRRSGR
jgi:acyl dehydratase